MALNTDILKILKEGTNEDITLQTKPVTDPRDPGVDYTKGIKKAPKRKGDKELGDDADDAKSVEHKDGRVTFDDVRGVQDSGGGPSIREEKEKDDKKDPEKDDDKKKDDKKDKKKSKNPFMKKEEKDDTDEDDEKEMAENVNALFAGEELTEDFKKKAFVIFEAAVNLRVSKKEQELQEKFDVALAEETSTIEEELENKVNTYLNYVVEEWTKEHTLAIENGIRVEITESFIAGLKNLFESHSIEIPETKIDLVQKLSEELQSVKNDLNETLKKNAQLTESIDKTKREEIVKEAIAGLPASQADKLKTLTENLVFKNAESFTEGVKVLKESFTGSKGKTQNPEMLTEDLQTESLNDKTTEINDPYMKQYLSIMERQANSQK